MGRCVRPLQRETFRSRWLNLSVRCLVSIAIVCLALHRRTRAVPPLCAARRESSRPADRDPGVQNRARSLAARASRHPVGRRGSLDSSSSLYTHRSDPGQVGLRSFRDHSATLSCVPVKQPERPDPVATLISCRHSSRALALAHPDSSKRLPRCHSLRSARALCHSWTVPHPSCRVCLPISHVSRPWPVPDRHSALLL